MYKNVTDVLIADIICLCYESKQFDINSLEQILYSNSKGLFEYQDQKKIPLTERFLIYYNERCLLKKYFNENDELKLYVQQQLSLIQETIKINIFCQVAIQEIVYVISSLIKDWMQSLYTQLDFMKLIPNELHTYFKHCKK